MKKRTRSILEELNSFSETYSSDKQIETSANNIIESSINLLNRIANNYNEVTAGELERRFINAIKSGDPKKFKRGMQKIIESKNNDSK